MRKSEMLSLVKGMQIQHKRNGQVLTVVAVQEDKIVCEEKTISVSNCTRWFDVLEVEQQIPEVVEPDNTILDDIEQADELTSEQDTTADTDTTTQDTEEQTNTSDLKDNNTQDDQLHNDTDTAVKKHIVEANTATPGQQIFENSISGVVIQHGCHLNRMKEYVKVGKEGYKGCLVYIRTARDKSWKFDVSKKTWNKLTSEYQQYLIEQYGASIVDASRGLWRIAGCNELDVFEVLLLAALKIA